MIAIFGPTASGKSAVAEALADRIPAELVSADAMQAYRGLPILTNQSSAPARLVAIWPLDHEGSVGEYAELAHAAIDEILAAGRTPIVVGGTGLYLLAALVKLPLPPPPAPGVRERWEAFYDLQGPAATHGLLANRDPAAAATLHPNDRRRVVRALELAEAGHSLEPIAGNLWTHARRHPTVLFSLTLPTDVLNRRIEERTKKMFRLGVVDEVRAALKGGVSQSVRRTVGLEEVATLPSQEAAEALALRTRRLAAYQRKWIRRMSNVIEIDANRSPDVVADEMAHLLADQWLDRGQIEK